MVGKARHRPTGYVQKGRHRWRMVGGYVVPGGSYGIHVCQVCGVRVDTRAPFPSKQFTEKWNGRLVPARTERPMCKGS